MAPVLQFRVDPELKERIEAWWRERGFADRSAFIRDALLAAMTSGEGGGDPGTVGTDSGSTPRDGGGAPTAPPSPPEPASSPPQAPPAAAPHSPAAPAAAAPAVPLAKCPDCGAPGGQHQAYCIQVTGRPPVRGPEDPPLTPESAAAMSAVESREDFIARRRAELVADGEQEPIAQAVAEGEWRQLTNSELPAPVPAAAQAPPAPPSFAQEPCRACGCMKLPTEQCRDCGARPTVVL